MTRTTPRFQQARVTEDAGGLRAAYAWGPVPLLMLVFMTPWLFGVGAWLAVFGASVVGAVWLPAAWGWSTLVVGAFLIVGGLFWSYFLFIWLRGWSGSERLTVDHAGLTLRRSMLGLGKAWRFGPADIRELAPLRRWVQARGGGYYEYEVGFTHRWRTFRFATGLPEPETRLLADRVAARLPAAREPAPFA